MAKQSSEITWAPLQTGQVWRVEDSDLQIRHVGKTLVQYQKRKGAIKRVPIKMSFRQTLETYLKDNHGILICQGKA
jgi:hypothetical protein